MWRNFGRGITEEDLYTRVNGERRWWKRIISLTALQCSHYAPIMMAHSSTNEGESQCTTGPYTLHLAANNSLWTLRHPANRYAEINDACSWCSSKLLIDGRSPLMFVQIDENIMCLQSCVIPFKLWIGIFKCAEFEKILHLYYINNYKAKENKFDNELK